MTREDIEDRVNEFLIEEFEVEEENIAPASNLKETLDLDSLDYVDLVVVIEQYFGFKVKGEDFIQIATLKDFYDYIENKVSQTA